MPIVEAQTDDPRLPRSVASYYAIAPARRTAVAEVVDRARVRSTLLLRDQQNQPKPHVAGLGESLYTDHLITVELAGAVLFVALVGALAIAAPKPPIRPGAASEPIEATAS